MVDETKIISNSAGVYNEYVYSATVGPVLFPENDILELIVYEVTGTCLMKIDVLGGVTSTVDVPEIQTARPHEYYKRNRRRRAC